jgi:hypothetical protein
MRRGVSFKGLSSPRALKWMSKKRLIHSQLDLKFWTESVPALEAVRPSRCTGCGAASRRPGRPLTVVGHGVRQRQLRGPTGVDAEPEELEVWQRRFRCRNCKAVMVVAPAHVLRYRLFSSVAIVWALTLYGVERLSAARVRQKISPWRVLGATAARQWRSLGNWVLAAQTRALLPVRLSLGRGPRQVSEAISWVLSALAPPAFRVQSPAHQAVGGMLHALMGIAP